MYQNFKKIWQNKTFENIRRFISTDRCAKCKHFSPLCQRECRPDMTSARSGTNVPWPTQTPPDGRCFIWKDVVAILGLEESRSFECRGISSSVLFGFAVMRLVVVGFWLESCVWEKFLFSCFSIWFFNIIDWSCVRYRN